LKADRKRQRRVARIDQESRKRPENEKVGKKPVPRQDSGRRDKKMIIMQTKEVLGGEAGQNRQENERKTKRSGKKVRSKRMKDARRRAKEAR
jgi:hypothetical protein